MPFLQGRNATVLWNSTVMSGYLTQTDFEVSVDSHDVTTYGAGWKSYLVGLLDSTTGFQGIHDAAAGTVIDAALAVDSGVLTYCPDGGTAIGGRARLVSATATNHSESSPVGDVVKFSWDVQSQSRTGFGQVLHPLGIDTDTTTGATKDDTVATSTGWVAHLHVTAVSAGSWVVKLQDATASNFSDGADVTGAAFTAATGATSQRLSSAGATTALRRYVRYVATRTGGSASDTITFHLSYARNY